MINQCKRCHITTPRSPASHGPRIRPRHKNVDPAPKAVTNKEREHAVASEEMVRVQRKVANRRRVGSGPRAIVLLVVRRRVLGLLDERIEFLDVQLSSLFSTEASCNHGVGNHSQYQMYRITSRGGGSPVGEGFLAEPQKLRNQQSGTDPFSFLECTAALGSVISRVADTDFTAIEWVCCKPCGFDH